MQVYEQLQEFLNKCLELWWKPFWIESSKRWKIDMLANICFSYRDDEYNKGKSYITSYHELFSVDSGIMEFVEWKESEYLDYKRIDTPKDYWYDTDWQYHVMIMWPMTVDLKIDYFLENTLLPTKQD